MNMENLCTSGYAMPGKYPADIRLINANFSRESQRVACEDIEAWVEADDLPETFSAMEDRSRDRDRDGFTRRHYSNMVGRFFGPAWGEHTFEWIEDNYAGTDLQTKLRRYRDDLESDGDLEDQRAETADLTDGPLTDRELALFRQGFNLGRQSARGDDTTE